eukprot:g53615.t1
MQIAVTAARGGRGCVPPAHLTLSTIKIFFAQENTSRSSHGASRFGVCSNYCLFAYDLCTFPTLPYTKEHAISRALKNAMCFAADYRLYFTQRLRVPCSSRSPVYLCILATCEGAASKALSFISLKDLGSRAVAGPPVYPCILATCEGAASKELTDYRLYFTQRLRVQCSSRSPRLPVHFGDM